MLIGAFPVPPRFTAAALLPFLSLLTPAAAQRLIGGANSAGVGPILATQAFCAASARLCGPVLAAPPTPWAGGTAYDPTRRVVWDTDGVRLVGVLATSVPACAVYCAPFAAPVPAGALATGLAFDESRSAVWMIDSSPSLSLLRVPATAICPALALRCDLTPVTPAGHVPGSLAFSERHQLVFWSTSNFGAGGPSNIVYVSSAVNPCVVTCRITIIGTVPCGGAPLGPITGMAFDDCTNRIYVTDGRAVLRATFVPPCTVITFQCCAAALIAPYYGLDLEPEHATVHGAGCLDAACGACPNMRLDAIGDPSLGNPAFALRISGAPGGSIGIVGIDGACGAGAALLCGLYYLPALPPLFWLGPNVLVGGACGGTHTYSLPIPLDPALCGGVFCAQGIIVCLPAGFGLTNALDLPITDT